MPVPKRLAPIFTWRSAILHSDLPSTTKLVALAISIYLNEMTHTAWPSAVTLARDTSLSDRSVREHVHILEREGWLRREERLGKTTLLSATTPEVDSGVPRKVVQDPPERGSSELEEELENQSALPHLREIQRRLSA